MQRSGLGRTSTVASSSGLTRRSTLLGLYTTPSYLSVAFHNHLPYVSQSRSIHCRSGSPLTFHSLSKNTTQSSHAINSHTIHPLSMHSNLRVSKLHTFASYGLRPVTSTNNNVVMRGNSNNSHRNDLSSLSLIRLSHRYCSTVVSTISEQGGEPPAEEPKKKKKKKRKYESALPDGHYMDPDDTYIPEVDWDHTRMEEHYQRLWEPRERPTEPKEKFYQFLLESFVAGSCIIVVGVIVMSVFIWRKMKRQLKFVQRTQRSLRKVRPIFEKHGLGLIPFDIKELDVSDLKQEMYSVADEDHMIEIAELASKSPTFEKLINLRMPLKDMISFEGTGRVDAGDMVFFLALMQYFCGQARRKGTPSIRRVVRDDMYQLISSFEPDGRVTLDALGHFCAGCFFLAILSPPNLGNEKIGGQTLDVFRVNYARYMLRDDSIQLKDEVVIRKFNFLYKICDFGIGLTAESRGQLQK